MAKRSWDCANCCCSIPGPIIRIVKGQINTVWLYSWLPMIYSRAVGIYISRELVWGLLVNSQRTRADKDPIPLSAERSLLKKSVKVMIICQSGVNLKVHSTDYTSPHLSISTNSFAVFLESISIFSEWGKKKCAPVKHLGIGWIHVWSNRQCKRW